MQLYKHQQRFVDRNPDKALLVWEAGTGKSLAGIEWLRRRPLKRLVVCPKSIKGKWIRDMEKHHIETIVMTKEEFKKKTPEGIRAVVFDEAHHHSSPLFAGKRSKIAEQTYLFIKNNPDMSVLLLTATPIRSTPWNLHTLLCYMGYYVDWKKWRDRFFELTVRPYLPRPAWLPTKIWRKDIRSTLEKHADIVLMKDCVGELPPITEEKIKLKPPTPFEPLDETDLDWNASAEWYAEHRHENGVYKTKEILRIAEQFRKVIVVCNYVDQVEEYAKVLSKDRQTYTLYGKTKDQDSVISNAQTDDECFLVVQAGMGEGYDADTFSCIIFASMSYKYIDYYQMQRRVRRIHNLHPVSYYFLLGGPKDEAVLKQIQLGKDFDPHSYLLKNKKYE